MQDKKFDNILGSISEFFGVLSHPDRIRILSLLKSEELDVSGIHLRLNISQSRVSQHLKMLKNGYLVEERRVGKHVYYKLKDVNVLKLMSQAVQIYAVGVAADPEALQLLTDILSLWQF